jgi:hypothetical protein
VGTSGAATCSASRPAPLAYQLLTFAQFPGRKLVRLPIHRLGLQASCTDFTGIISQNPVSRELATHQSMGQKSTKWICKFEVGLSGSILVRSGRVGRSRLCFLFHWMTFGVYRFA